MNRTVKNISSQFERTQRVARPLKSQIKHVTTFTQAYVYTICLDEICLTLQYFQNKRQRKIKFTERIQHLIEFKKILFSRNKIQHYDDNEARGGGAKKE
jgi:glycopeptide antibiotics resistance protein